MILPIYCRLATLAVSRMPWRSQRKRAMVSVDP